MKLTARVSVCASVALVAAVLGTVACEDSNAPTNAIGTTGGATSSSNGGASATPEGGTSTGVGGASTTATGGVSTTAAGGSSAGVGGATTASGGATPGVCNYPTASNPPPAGGVMCTVEAKGAACTTEAAVCYKTCGPTLASGWKSETCTGGIIAEVSTCVWTGTDYSAFKVPALTAIDPTCPATAPQATTACTTAGCVPCADSTGGYLDSGGALKAGWCTCVNSKWSCGTSPTAWPCTAPGVGQPGC